MKSLPSDLETAAQRFGSELAWCPSDARRVIEFLRDAGYAVLGVEIWTSEGASPKVWGWSVYEVPYDGDWHQFVQENAARALRELEKPLPTQGLVNLTWIDETERGK